MLVDTLGVADQLLAPLCAQQIKLLEKIEELVLRPFRIGEAFVLRIGGDGGRRLLAGHAFGGGGPEVEIGAAEVGLQLESARGI